MRNRTGIVRRDAEGKTAIAASGRANFRRLRANELVWSSDYLMDTQLGMQLWDGPGGFQAGTFTKPVYRKRGASIPQSTSNREKQTRR